MPSKATKNDSIAIRKTKHRDSHSSAGLAKHRDSGIISFIFVICNQPERYTCIVVWGAKIHNET